MNIIEIPINQIKPYKKNARFNENAIPKVAESIKQFGFRNPIIVDKNMSVIAGHTRLASAKLLGLEKVPCIIADDLTPKQVKAFRLVDNRTSEFASWNYDLLQSELETLDIDLSDFEFPDLTYEDTLSAEELESILDDDTDPTSEYGKDDDDEETGLKDFSHKDEYKVEITCKNQTEQESLYYELVKRGLNVRTYQEDSRRGGRGSSSNSSVYSQNNIDAIKDYVEEEEYTVNTNLRTNEPMSDYDKWVVNLLNVAENENKRR